MPFSRLLLCALEGDCSHEEEKVKVSLQSIRGATTLLFKLDKHSTQSRTALGREGRDQGKLCDLLYCVVGRGDSDELRRVLCFVELKGAGTDAGFRQLCDTAADLRARLPRDLRGVAIYMGVMRTHGSSPALKRPYKDGLLGDVKVLPTNELLQSAIEKELGRGA